MASERFPTDNSILKTNLSNQNFNGFINSGAAGQGNMVTFKSNNGGGGNGAIATGAFNSIPEY